MCINFLKISIAAMFFKCIGRNNLSSEIEEDDGVHFSYLFILNIKKIYFLPKGMPVYKN